MAETFRIGFLLYPNLTQLDLTGPAQVLSAMSGAKLHYVWKTLEPVPSDCDLSLMPTDTFESCPDLDMICVPGGSGQTAVMEDEAALAWLKRQGAQAQYVTSVCTGSLILGAAGLLRGYKACCHWGWRDLLSHFGAEPVNARVVIDRNRITGGGVTAGIDFGFQVIEELRGAEQAQAVQLYLEYDPAPRHKGGTPETAPPAVLARVEAAIGDRLRHRREQAERLGVLMMAD